MVRKYYLILKINFLKEGGLGTGHKFPLDYLEKSAGNSSIIIL
jgi:hypothetical protein